MTGGGIINRKSISILLLLITIALPLNVGAISAATTSQTNIIKILYKTQQPTPTHKVH